MKTFPARGVLLDLDGTIVDSLPDITAALNLMLRDFGLSPCSQTQTRTWIGDGARTLVHRALRSRSAGPLDGLGGAEPEEQTTSRALGVFVRAYQSNLCVHSALYPGVKTTLDLWRQQGLALGCVTNKPAALSESLLRALGIRPLLGVVVGGDTLAEKKPHPAPVHGAAQALGYRAEDLVMVGDSTADIAAARAAGCPILWVSYGYGGGTVRQSQPDAVVDCFQDLQRHVVARKPGEGNHVAAHR